MRREERNVTVEVKVIYKFPLGSLPKGNYKTKTSHAINLADQLFKEDLRKSFQGNDLRYKAKAPIEEIGCRRREPVLVEDFSNKLSTGTTFYHICRVKAAEKFGSLVPSVKPENYDWEESKYVVHLNDVLPEDKVIPLEELIESGEITDWDIPEDHTLVERKVPYLKREIEYFIDNEVTKLNKLFRETANL